MAGKDGELWRDTDAFLTWMEKGFTTDAPDGSRITFQALAEKGMALDGRFKGPFAKDVLRAHEEGIGRMLRTPEITGNMYEGVSAELYEDFAFALPLTSLNKVQIREALVVFSGKYGNDFCVVTPAISTSQDLTLMRAENRVFTSHFTAVFGPDTNPSTHPVFRLGPEEKPFDAFKRNPEAFGAAITQLVEPSRKNSLLHEAILSGRRIKRNS